MSKRPLLQAPDLSVLPGRSLPKTITDDSRFKSAEALEEPEALARRVQDGSVRVINTDTVLPAKPASVGTPEPPKAPAYQRGPETTLSTKVPDYVLRELKITAAQKGTTIRNLLLEALKKDGFKIKDEDIQDDRKRR
jgi:hypothetical protein